MAGPSSIFQTILSLLPYPSLISPRAWGRRQEKEKDNTAYPRAAEAENQLMVGERKGLLPMSQATSPVSHKYCLRYQGNSSSLYLTPSLQSSLRAWGSWGLSVKGLKPGTTLRQVLLLREQMPPSRHLTSGLPERAPLSLRVKRTQQIKQYVHMTVVGSSTPTKKGQVAI